MDLDEILSEIQELKRVVLEQASVVKTTCSSSIEGLHHTSYRSDMNITNSLLQQVKFLKEEVASKTKIISMLLEQISQYTENIKTSPKPEKASKIIKWKIKVNKVPEVNTSQSKLKQLNEIRPANHANKTEYKTTKNVK